MARYLLCVLAIVVLMVATTTAVADDMSAKADTMIFWDSGKGEFDFPSVGNEFIVWEPIQDDLEGDERFSVVFGIITPETTIRIRNRGIIGQEDLKILSGSQVFVSGEFERIDEYVGEGSRTLCLSMEITVLAEPRK